MSAFTQTNTPNLKLSAIPTEPIWRFSVNQYHQMIALGILTEDDPVELLEGGLFIKCRKTLHTVLLQNSLEMR